MSAQALRKYIPGRSTPGKLAGIDPERLLDRIANGDYPANIARELDVSRPALHYKISGHPEYQLCREIGMEIRLDDGLEKVHSAPDLNIARMEEVKLRRLEWRAEREFPHRWGVKQMIAVVPIALDQVMTARAAELLAIIEGGIIADDSEIIASADVHAVQVQGT